MNKKVFDSRLEESKLKQCQTFFNRGFMVTVLDNNDNIIFSPYMINNFSIDSNKIFITVYDLIQNYNIEEKLDELSKGFWIFKPKLNVILMRLDVTNKEVYRVNYKKCRLIKYHGKNFTYKGDEPHQWYLELSFSKKEIIKNEDFDFISIKNEYDHNPTPKELGKNFSQQRHKRYIKKEAEILKNSNRMLDEAAEKVISTKRLTSSEKKEKLKEINNAKAENEESAMKFLNVNLKTIEEKLVNDIIDLENNIDI